MHAEPCDTSFAKPSLANRTRPVNRAPYTALSPQRRRSVLEWPNSHEVGKHSARGRSHEVVSPPPIGRRSRGRQGTAPCRRTESRDRQAVPVDDAIGGERGEPLPGRQDADQVQRISAGQRHPLAGRRPPPNLAHQSHRIRQGELLAREAGDEAAAANFPARFEAAVHAQQIAPGRQPSRLLRQKAPEDDAVTTEQSARGVLDRRVSGLAGPAIRAARGGSWPSGRRFRCRRGALARAASRRQAACAGQREPRERVGPRSCLRSRAREPRVRRAPLRPADAAYARLPPVHQRRARRARQGSRARIRRVCSGEAASLDGASAIQSGARRRSMRAIGVAPTGAGRRAPPFAPGGGVNRAQAVRPARHWASSHEGS